MCPPLAVLCGGENGQISRSHYQMDALADLQVLNDLKKVVGPWLAIMAKHAHQACGIILYQKKLFPLIKTSKS